MRLLHTLNDQKKGRMLSAFLASEGIDNELEIAANTDWGSPNYGDVSCKIWVYDEDQIQKAQRWIEKYDENPEDPIFKQPPANVPFISSAPAVRMTEQPKLRPAAIKKEILGNQQVGIFTFSLLFICCLLFILTEITSPPLPSTFPSYLPPVALFASPVKKSMLYDYPKAYEIAEKLSKLYELEKLQSPRELPPEGQSLLKLFYNTPYWEGVYPIFLKMLQHLDRRALNPTSKFEIIAPLFEKIRQGEFWRLFSPCLLHNDILHLLFNMIWLVVLGKQLEERLGAIKYLFLALLTGIFSNTCQYLMSGANFIGFSGILCGMLTFIWIRKKTAPWEGYPLQAATINFMFFFILAMLTIQVFSFYLEIKGQISISPAIANTAHITGGLLGTILGRISLFSWKT